MSVPERVPWRRVDETRAMQRLKDTYARRTCSSRLSESRPCELASSTTFSCSPRRCSPPGTLPAGQVLVDKTVPKIYLINFNKSIKLCPLN